MLYTVEDDLELCIKLKVSPKQLMYLKMLMPDSSYLDSELRVRNYEWCLKFQGELKGLSPDELADLISRDFLIDLNDADKYQHDYFKLTDKASLELRRYFYSMAWELHEEYPDFLSRKNDNGNPLAAKTCTENEIIKDYIRAINNDQEEHKRVLEDVRWAKKNNMILMGLKKFVGSRHWNAIREYRKTKSKPTSNVKLGF